MARVVKCYADACRHTICPLSGVVCDLYNGSAVRAVPICGTGRECWCSRPAVGCRTLSRPSGPLGICPRVVARADRTEDRHINTSRSAQRVPFLLCYILCTSYASPPRPLPPLRRCMTALHATVLVRKVRLKEYRHPPTQALCAHAHVRQRRGPTRDSLIYWDQTTLLQFEALPVRTPQSLAISARRLLAHRVRDGRGRFALHCGVSVSVFISLVSRRGIMGDR